MVENGAFTGVTWLLHDRRARALRAVRLRPTRREGDGAAPV